MDPDQAFRSHIRDKRANAVVAAIVLSFAAIVAVNLLPSDDRSEQSIVAVPSTASLISSPSPSPSPKQVATTGPTLRVGLSGYIDPGRYFVAWPDRPIRDAKTAQVVPGINLTLPAGWKLAPGLSPSRPTITRDSVRLRLFQDVTHVVADVCARDVDLELVPVGPTVKHLRVALGNQVGIERSGPDDVLLGGYPASRYVLDHPGGCPGPEGDQIWAGGTPDSDFSVLDFGVGTIFVADVNEHRLVITSDYRDASAEALAELETVIASIDIAAPPFEQDQGGRYSGTVDGIPSHSACRWAAGRSSTESPRTSPCAAPKARRG